MMDGRMREYTWQDIMNLIYEDMGLSTDEQRRQRGGLRYVGNFEPPSHEKETCIRVTVYDLNWDERIRSHVEEDG